MQQLVSRQIGLVLLTRPIRISQITPIAKEAAYMTSNGIYPNVIWSSGREYSGEVSDATRNDWSVTR